MKTPSELNVMFVSMERSGVSWVVRILSKIHEIMFNSEIDFYPEISRSISITPSYRFPKGWFCVYSIDPEDLLKCGYDKVVSIQRSFNTLCKVYAMYYKNNIPFEECLIREPLYFENIRKYYQKTYDKVNKITDPRYKNFLLDDFNNYSSITFNELMNFLEFPKENRPVLFPVNPPERNWQSYSTILASGEELGSRLMEIDERYKYDLLEIELQDRFLDRIKGCKNNKPNFVIRKPKKIIIPKINRRESVIQKNKKFRLDGSDMIDTLEINDLYKILIITPVGYGLGCHLGEGMKWGFEHLGHEVQLISYKDLIKIRLLPRKLLNVSEIIKKYNVGGIPDFIFINQMHCQLVNDIDIPIFYFHTGWHLPLGISGKHIINYFRQSQLTLAYDLGKRVNKTMFHGVNPTYFYPEEKTIKGVNGIGFRRWWDNWRNIVKDFTPIIDMMEWETNQFIELGYNWFSTPIDDNKYRALLRKMEAINPLIGYTEFVSRRMIEAMACKTLYVYRLDFIVNEDGTRDDSIHRKMLENMGYYSGIHYIEIKNNYDIEHAWNEMTEEMKEEMREKAYEVTIKNHTHVNRAQQVIKDFENEEWKNAEN